MLEMLLLIISA